MKKNIQFLGSALISALVLTATASCAKKSDPKDVVTVTTSAKPKANSNEVLLSEESLDAKSKSSEKSEDVQKFILQTERIRPLKSESEPPISDEEKRAAVQAAEEKKEAEKKEAQEKLAKEKKIIDLDDCTEALNTTEKKLARKKAWEEKQAIAKKAEEASLEEQKNEFEKNRQIRKNQKIELANKVIPAATDIEAIKQTALLKFNFKDLKSLKEFSDTDSVMFHGKILNIKEAMAILEKGDEDSFCRVEGASAFNEKDYLVLSSGTARQLVNKEADIYETRLDFKNSNGVFSFVCNHAAPGFYLQDVALSFKAFMNFYDPKNKFVDGVGFVNLSQEERMLNVIQILDVNKMNQIVLVQNKEGMALVNGQVQSADQAFNFIAANNLKEACTITQKKGEFDTKKIYYRTGHTTEQTPKNIPTGTVVYTYTADSENSFDLSCMVQKTTPSEELLNVGKGVIKFGAVGRLEYKAKMDKINLEQAALDIESAQDDSIWEADLDEVNKMCPGK